MKKLLILVLTNFFILTLILLGKPAKAQTTTITGQFLYGLQLYVLPEKQTPPDYSTAIYTSTIDENDFITSGLYENWLQPRLPDGINGYIYLVDSTHTIKNVYLGGGYLEQGQTLSYPYEPSIEMKHYNAPLITIFIINPVNKGFFETPTLDYIVYHENNDGSTPRIKLIDATSNENDYNRVKLAINGYDTGYNAGYSIGYNNGQVNGYNSGYEDGQNNGYNAGYNAGQYDFYNDYYQQIYEDGYNAGLGDRQIGVNSVVNFNQLVQNPLFSPPWDSFGLADKYVENDTITILAQEYLGRIYNQVYMQNGHKYYIKFDYKQPIGYNRLILVIARDSNYIINLIDATGEFITYQNIITWGQSSGNCTLYFGDRSSADFENISIRYPIIFDLTQIYGVGNEPTNTETIVNDFPSNYYPYTLEEYINIEYQNGYITGKNDGFSIGYDDGKSYQATQQLTSDGWIKNIFTGIGSFLALEILPGVSIGLIVGIPFIITVAWFVLKMARGGSAE